MKEISTANTISHHSCMSEGTADRILSARKSEHATPTLKETTTHDLGATGVGRNPYSTGSS